MNNSEKAHLNNTDRSRQRRATRIDLDYRELNRSGKRIEKVHIGESICINSDNSSSDDTLSFTADSQEEILEDNSSEIVDISNLVSQLDISDKMANDLEDLKDQLMVLEDDISDYLEENPISGAVMSTSDIDDSTNKVEGLRTQFRTIHVRLKKLLKAEYNEEFLTDYERMITRMKEYVNNAKEMKNLIRHNELEVSNYEKELKERKETETSNQAKISSSFLVDEVLRLIGELHAEFNKSKINVSSEEIQRRQEEFPDNMSQLERLSNKVHNVLEVIPETFPNKDNIVQNIKDEYKIVLAEKNLYEQHFEKEFRERDLLKEKSFQSSSLNIRIPKFKGFESTLDIYSFQMEFEKLHLKGTPKSVLPDLLKNNYLVDPALALVKSVDDIQTIWDRLKKSYGDPKMMLKKKFSDVINTGPLWKMKDDHLLEGLMKIINSIKDLMNLARKHKIENKLYYGEGLDIIYGLLGDSLINRWLSSTINEELEGKELWERLLMFLEQELRLQQGKLLIKGTARDRILRGDEKVHPRDERDSKGDSRRHPKDRSYFADSQKVDGKCYICDEFGHVRTNGPKGSTLIQYFACEKFVEMTPQERFKVLRQKGLCFQCLYPGATHTNGTCQRDFTCKHSSHEKYPQKKHVLVCQEHCADEVNKKTFNDYKSRFIDRQKVPLKEFSKSIKLSFHTISSDAKSYQVKCNSNNEELITDSAIYTLQTIKVNNELYTLFFDSGCSDLVSRYSAIKRMKGNASLELEGPLPLGGVGEIKVESPYGIYQIKLPTHDKGCAVMSGICLDNITGELPMYPLQGQVEKDIHDAYKSSGKPVSKLPRLPKFIGGEVDFMIGSKYLRYYPDKVFSLPSGLTIYRSPFVNADGGRGVIGGPHAIFTEIDRSMGKTCQYSYLSEQYQLYKMGYQINPDASLLNMKYPKDFRHNLMSNIYHDSRCNLESEIKCLCFTSVRKQKHFEEVENAATEVLYRCVDCRSCQKCKNGEQIELLSIKEEVEQDVINKSVTVDVKTGVTKAKLPLIDDPAVKLVPNKNKALAVYRSQVAKLSKCDKDKEDVIKSEGKLQALGHVEYVKNLTDEQQRSLQQNPIKNFIPWRSVWNSNSISTPCRIVFDASQATNSGVSLNDVVAKGRNNMNRLVEIVIRWSMHRIGFHTDVQKMYNSVKLTEDHWCLQRYIWQQNLDPTVIPEEKVIKTLIYGVKSSGNQAERGLRETARIFKDKYPEVRNIVEKDIYVDDCISGEVSTKLAFQRADEITLVLRKGGFGLKGFTFTGKSPGEDVSEDGESINVAGMRWFSKNDELQLDISTLNFSKKLRGKKKVENAHQTPINLTRRHCVGKVAEIFDLVGKITPITASMKLDLHELVQRNLDWDDRIPDSLRPIWMSHFQMMKELKGIRFKRAVIPDDAVSLQIDTVDTADASKSIACIAIYARYLRKCGEYSCQLVFSRSKLIADGMTQPRAELLAANLNAHTGEVVKRSFGQYHKSSIKLTDSQITLHWIYNRELPLKQWIRNRVVDICRFNPPESWKYIRSKDMVADIGTRRGATIEDVSAGSVWQEGHDWMKLDVSRFPVKTVDEIKLDSSEVNDVKKEMMTYGGRNENLSEFEWPQNTSNHSSFITLNVTGQSIPKDVLSRYEFSKYIVDPNRHRFQTVVRIIAIVRRFIKNFIGKYHKKCTQSSDLNIPVNTEQLESSGTQTHKRSLHSRSRVVVLSDEEIKEASNYYYRKATLELKKFVKETKYKSISVERNEILYYTGRLLPGQQFNIVANMTDVMKDLTSTTFHVPIVDKHSPVAYSVINEVHWHHDVAKHSGVETVLRYTMDYCHIIEGRDIVKTFRKNCARCRLLAKRTIDICMGPKSKYNLTIAPAYYITQVDLSGPFKAFSRHNKRTTLKIYLVIFCCSTTSTVNIKVMEDYGTSSFIQAFIRFSCEVGYPKMMLPDEGSQLVKGCESMKLNFQDLKSKLHLNHNVEFELCPVGGHNMHGKVERKIRSIKESLAKSIQNERLSIIEWETLGSQISNSINDTPLALGNVVSELENIDLITPNRLRLGRNNNRSPVGPLFVTGNPSIFLKDNEQIFKLWFEGWLISCVPQLIKQPKWFNSDINLSEGDVVLFLKEDASLVGRYQYGMVDSVEKGRDGKVRTVHVKYQNSNENMHRKTRRAVRELVVIHPINELCLMRELGEIATFADVKCKLELEREASLSS